MAIKSSDQITIVDVTDAYSVILTSEAYTFVGGTSGASSGLTCNTQAVAFCGTNQCPSVTVNKDNIVCPTGISASVSNSGTSAVTITFTTTATISAACEATIPVQVDGITVNKKFSFAVAKTGSTGAKGDTGAAGKGISSTVVTYNAHTSGTEIPTDTWSDSVPSASAGQFVWTRTVITYTDNTTTTSYSVGKIGNTGSTGATGATGATGKGVKSTEVKYQASSSGTTAPTGTWGTSIPSLSAGQYLWTRTVITYTDDTTSTSYSVGMKGATGAKGDTGAAGADAITMNITTSGGTVFKNSTGSTELTAHVYKGGVEQSITDAGVCGSLGTVKWYATTTVTGVKVNNVDGKTLNATTGVAGKKCVIDASDIDNTACVYCQLED